jgi:hypothetical protein
MVHGNPSLFFEIVRHCSLQDRRNGETLTRAPHRVYAVERSSYSGEAKLKISRTLPEKR